MSSEEHGQSWRRAFAWTDPRQRAGAALGPVLFLASGLGLRHGAGLAGPEAWAGAVVVLMACWWITETLPLWATACLPLPLFPLFGSAPLFTTALQYFDPVNFLFLGGMWIAACMQQWGLHRRIALGVVWRIGSSPARIVLGFMLGTSFITLWISNTASAMMMFPIAMAVLRKFEERVGPDDPGLRRFGAALMLGLAYSASIGGIGSKIGTGTNLVFVKNATAIFPNGVDFLTWAKMGMPVVLICVPLVWFYLTRIGGGLPKGDFAGGRAAIEEERRTLGRMNRGEWVALGAFVSAALLWIFRRDIDLGFATLPGWWRLVTFGWADWLPLATWPPAVAKLFADTGDAMVAVAVSCLLFLIPVRAAGGKVRPALGPREAGKVSWGLLVLLGGGFAMAHGIQESGLSDRVALLVGRLGSPNPVLSIFVVCLIAVVLTEVASNTATASILLPILAGTAPALGLHPAPIMLAVTMTASFGFMLPAGTPPNAVVFSSGYITVPQMARSGLLVDLLGVGLITALCVTWVPWVLGVPLRLPAP